MIGIHRTKPVIRLGRREIRLRRTDHLLLTTLGMMDNRVASNELLIETALENPVKIPDDINVLRLRIGRLRQKLGHGRIRNKSGRGYILTGEVYFFDEPS